MTDDQVAMVGDILRAARRRGASPTVTTVKRRRRGVPAPILAVLCVANLVAMWIVRNEFAAMRAEYRQALRLAAREPVVIKVTTPVGRIVDARPLPDIR